MAFFILVKRRIVFNYENSIIAENNRMLIHLVLPFLTENDPVCDTKAVLNKKNPNSAGLREWFESLVKNWLIFET